LSLSLLSIVQYVLPQDVSGINGESNHLASKAIIDVWRNMKGLNVLIFANFFLMLKDKWLARIELVRTQKSVSGAHIAKVSICSLAANFETNKTISLELVPYTTVESAHERGLNNRLVRRTAQHE
jgi:hypothetical protein